MNFTRKGYGRIYVVNKDDIAKVDSIIQQMDAFEYEYLPDDFIAPFSEYPGLCYTHKFDGLDTNALTAICLKQGISIFCCDNGYNEYMKDGAAERFGSVGEHPTTGQAQNAGGQ